MTRDTTITVLAVGIVVLLIAMGVVAWFVPPHDVKDAAATLAIITATAVGIERILETFWAFMGQIQHSWWPLNVVGTQVEKMLSDLNNTLNPFYAEAKQAIDDAVTAGKFAREKVAAAKQNIDGLQQQLQDYAKALESMKPDNQKLQLFTALAAQGVADFQKTYPDIAYVTVRADQAINAMSAFATTFKDNPARRFISIIAGGFLGVAVAGLLGLDLFKAAGGTEISFDIPLDIQNVLGIQIDHRTLNFGVALTGLVMGLGSNPTHEVIRAVQEYKKGRKVANIPPIA
jgi:hypothetical protein